MDWLRWLFETEAYRNVCPTKDARLSLAFAVADGGIALAYFGIPALVAYLLYRRPYLPFKILGVLLGLFVSLCGTTHLLAALTPVWPAYNLQLVVHYATMFVSLFTMVVVAYSLPEILRRKTVEELSHGLTDAEKLQRVYANVARIKEIAKEEDTDAPT